MQQCLLLWSPMGCASLVANGMCFSGRQWDVYNGTMWYPTLGLSHSSTAKLRHHHEYIYKSELTSLTVLQNYYTQTEDGIVLFSNVTAE